MIVGSMQADRKATGSVLLNARFMIECVVFVCLFIKSDKDRLRPVRALT